MRDEAAETIGRGVLGRTSAALRAPDGLPIAGVVRQPGVRKPKQRFNVLTQTETAIKGIFRMVG
jgi:hypothetical protein